MSQTLDLRLYLVTDRRLAGPRGVLETVRGAVAGGVTLVQVRSPESTGRDFVEEARVLKAMLAPLGLPLIVNDRVDVALAADADGVHVGQSDIDPRDVRAMIGRDKIIGLSVGSADEWATSHDQLGAVDYIGVGPVHGTATKSDAGAPIGLEGLADMRRLSHLPIVAIGGIGLDTAADVMTSGADGIAVVSAIMAAGDPEGVARQFRRSIDQVLDRRRERI